MTTQKFLVDQEMMDDKPDWYRETTQGLPVQMCVSCISFGFADPLPAVIVHKGNSLCYQHFDPLDLSQFVKKDIIE